MWREIPPIFLSGHWEKRTEYKTAWSQACRACGRQCSILTRHAYPGAFLPGLKSHLWDLPVMILISSSPEISFLFCIFGGRDCSFLTNHQENPSQMTMRYYLISIRMVIIKNQKVTSTNEDVELCTPMVGVWNGAAAPKQNWSFKKKIFSITIWSSNAMPEYLFQKKIIIMISKGHLSCWVHCIVFHNCQDAETAWIHQQLDEFLKMW